MKKVGAAVILLSVLSSAANARPPTVGVNPGYDRAPRIAAAARFGSAGLQAKYCRQTTQAEVDQNISQLFDLSIRASSPYGTSSDGLGAPRRWAFPLRLGHGFGQD
jgi:hypothetical protein